MTNEEQSGVAVLVVDDAGERRVRLALGDTVLTTLQDANVAVGSVCGGNMSCGTCHVYIELPGVDCERVRSPEETALLEDSRHFRRDRSRLACQVEVTAALAAARIVVAPDE
ncbi:2Fe-2S iron-sulfur cluster-binding protein [Steroidobacter flavus]|uniref:2Fe-2S iron-sulfur cluster-binding protein n=1 Tax=Steroidobacter flavus TaxID=1842136 RepID=A0ABV8T3J8_9GAMM